MQAAPTPPDEAARLRTLRSLGVLDTPPEERFDRITRLAQKLFDVPIALVSLIDADRQWFKSKQGLDARETHRDLAFCGHAILQDDVFIVPDASKDDRFADNPLVAKDPSIRFYAGAPLAAPNGSRVGTLCVIDKKPRTFDPSQIQVLKDLADLVRAELTSVRLSEALTDIVESEGQLQDFLDNAAELIQRVSLEGKLLYVNRTWLRTMGYEPEDVPKLSVMDIIHPAQKAHVQELLGQVGGGGSLREVETVFVAKGGRAVPVLGSVNCQTRDGVPVATRGIFRDMTARAEVDRVRREVAHHVHHELRNPLAALHMAIMMLTEETAAGKSPEQRPLLDIMIQSTVQLQKMAEDLLDVTRSETGKLAVAPEPVDLGALVRAVAEALRPLAAKKGIALEAEVSGATPTASADPVRCRQILGNLIDNAVKFTPKGGRIRVTLRAHDEPGFVLAGVSDTGPGMAAGDQERVFDRLYQVSHIMKDGQQGLGLGLNICKELVQRQGGRIWAESALGKGSTFYFTLPVQHQK